jgi:ribosome-binding factor A
MASERTIERIASWIQRKVATMLVRDLKDPRAGYLLTVTRVNVTKDLETCAVFYSVLGDDKQKRRAAMMLERATPWVQREVAKGLRTRIAPRLHFEFDESIEGTSHMSQLLDRLSKERESREAGEHDTNGASDESQDSESDSPKPTKP